MFEEINGKLWNLINIDRIEKYSYEDEYGNITAELHYYSAKSQGIIKESFNTIKERDAKYDKILGRQKKGLLG